MTQFRLNDEVRGLAWEVPVPKATIVISHGMAEHASRYARFAAELNKHHYSVFAIDQIGHGVPPLHTKGHWDDGDFDNCIENLHTLIQNIHAKHTTPVILFGHSMGSFIAQGYIAKYGNTIQACVLSGTNGPASLFKMGHMMASLCGIFNKKDKPSKTMNNMSFGSYNKAFQPTKTDFDWLSRDEAEVKKYVEDPDCGYVCTIGFFKEFMRGLSHLHTEEKLNSIPKKLPILIVSGSQDPVGAASGGTEKLYQVYQKHNLEKVTHKLFEGGRHEMLNEINRDEVMKYLIEYFDHQI